VACRCHYCSNLLLLDVGLHMRVLRAALCAGDVQSLVGVYGGTEAAAGLSV